MEDIQQLTCISRDPPVPDTRDLPVSCTTSEGVQIYIYAIFGYRTQSLLHLLSHHLLSHRHDILMRQRDSHILLHYTTYTDTAARPGFDVANFQQVYPIAHGKLPIPHTSLLLTAFVFHDDDLHSNLFGVSPLTEHGLWPISHIYQFKSSLSLLLLVSLRRNEIV